MTNDFEVEVQCPKCKAELSFPVIYRGLDCKCPYCDAIIRLSDGVAASEPEAEPEEEWIVVDDDEEIESPEEDYSFGASQAVEESGSGFRSYYPSASGRAYVCVGVDDGLRPADLAQKIIAVTQQPRTHVFRALRLGMGILTETAAENARRIVQRLSESRCPAFALDVSLAPRITGHQRLNRVHAVPEALALQLDFKGSFRAVPWRTILGIGAGVSARTSYVYRRGEPISSHDPYYEAGPLGKRERKTEEQMQAYIVAADQERGENRAFWFSFNDLQVNYDCLGGQKTMSGTTNLKRFLALVCEKSGRAFLAPRMQRYVTEPRGGLQRFEDRRDMTAYCRWMTCCSVALFGPIA